MPLKELISHLKEGQVSTPQLYALSNQSRDELGDFEQIWPDLPTDVRRQTIQALVDIVENDFEPDFGQAFRIALADTDAIVREAAIEGLWEDEDIRLVPLFAELLHRDQSPQVRTAAASSLGRFVLLGELAKIQPRPHRRAYQALMAACTNSDESIQVRRRALESISYSCQEEIADLINAAYEDAEEEMRVSSVFAMGRSGDKQWSDCVLKELVSIVPAMRYEAIRACGELNLREAAPRLIEFAHDADIEVQEAAIWALGQIGGEEAHRALVECTQKDSESTRDTALAALREYELLYGDVTSLLLPEDLIGLDDGYDFEDDDEEEEVEEEDW